MGFLFLASALLGGLIFAIAPTLVHLISRRQARLVRFAAIEFVLRSRRRTARSIRLRQFLLLAIRTLFIVAAILAIARPVMRDEVVVQETTAAPIVYVVVVDVSASMQATLDGKSAFSHAIAKAVDTVRDMPDDVRIAAISCEETPRDVVQQPTFDRNEVLKALSSLKVTYHRSDLSACLARARSVAALVNGEGERRIAIFSDLAAHALGPIQTGDGRGFTVEWIAAFDEQEPFNRGLSRVSVERNIGAVGDGIDVKFTVSQFGGTEAEVPADLIVDGRRISRIVIPLGPEKSVARTFSHGAML